MSEAPCGPILVVDDEEYVTRVVSRCLSARGYECERASNGQEALEALRGRKFALLITDITMPGMSGMELLEQAQAEFPRTAVIMLTAVDDRDTATRAVELGAYGYIIKPFEQNEVIINVANALRRRSLEAMRDDFEGQLREEIRRSQSEIVMRLMAASEYRDDETGAHIRRIGLFSDMSLTYHAPAAGLFEKTSAGIKFYSPGYRKAGHVHTARAYALAGQTWRMKWMASGLGGFMGVHPVLQSEGAKLPSGMMDIGYLSTGNQYNWSVLISDNTWYYTRVTFTTSGYAARTASGGFDDQGGTVIQTRSGALTAGMKYHLQLRQGDPHMGPGPYIIIGSATLK